ncbi:MAG TPA: hypothetical protein VFQ23_15550 [Anaerolineales bacterium]|nr:hypothetical protein [Anaerolineales bacterium]
MKEKIRTIVSVILIVVVSTILLTDTTGRVDAILTFIKTYRVILVIGFIFLFIAIFVISIWIGSIISGEAAALKKHPKFFEEMQAVLQNTLIPLGYKEDVGPSGGLGRYVNYSRGESSVKLRLDVRDSIYYLNVASSRKTTTVKNDVIGEYELPLWDFSVEGHIAEADRFKNDSITKLNKWLFEQGIK